MADNVVSFHIPDPMMQKLDALSRAMKRDTSALAKEALSDYLLRQDVQAGAIDEALLAADGGEFISHEAMSEWLDSWGTDHEIEPPRTDVIKAKR
jgi:predicted transcriptional regulator